jgi:hypothetical protein
MVVEEIRRLQKECRDKAEAERVAAEKLRLQKEEEERVRKKEEQRRVDERNSFVTEQTKRILKETGILDDIIRIDKELLNGAVENHAIIYHLNEGKVELVWGSNFKVVDGSIRGVGSNWDYSVIEIYTNPDKIEIAIQGKEVILFRQNQLNKQWNIENIKKALINAYMDPIRVHHEYTPSDSGGGDWCCS